MYHISQGNKHYSYWDTALFSPKPTLPELRSKLEKTNGGFLLARRSSSVPPTPSKIAPTQASPVPQIFIHNCDMNALSRCSQSHSVLDISESAATANLARTTVMMMKETTSASNLSLDQENEYLSTVALKSILRQHCDIQKFLFSFNDSFSPFLIIFVIQIFTMSVGIFFLLCKSYLRLLNDPFFFFLYIYHGILYLMRGTIVLYFFGRVKESASNTKHILITHLRVQETCPELRQEIQLFISQLEDVYISGGSYIFFSKGFLISFYSILVTYVAIMVEAL